MWLVHFKIEQPTEEHRELYKENISCGGFLSEHILSPPRVLARQRYVKQALNTEQHPLLQLVWFLYIISIVNCFNSHDSMSI